MERRRVRYGRAHSQRGGVPGYDRMTAPDPGIQPELRAQRRRLLTVIAMLVRGCGVLAIGWRNAESDKEVMRADKEVAQTEKDRILTLYTLVAGLAEDAGFVVDTLRAALTAENQRLYLEGSRKLLEDRNIPAPPEAGR